MKLSTLKPLLHTPRKKSSERIVTEPYRAWYNTARWKELRLKIFDRDMYTCQYKGCGRLEGNTSKLVAHHKKAHKGIEELFWDENNLETVCKSCHDGPIAAAERKDIQGVWY